MIRDKLKELTVFFPAYNEAGNIKKTLADAAKYIQKVSDKYEIIVVDDGSSDDTSLLVAEYGKKHSFVKLVSHPKNLGYGASIKTGLKEAQYDWGFFTDSDGQFQFDELPHFISLRDQADVVIGYRHKRRDPLLRLILAQVLLKYWNLLLFGLRLKDVDCAYKLIPKNLLDNITLETSSAITITELMTKLIRNGATIHQTPINHYERKMGIQTGSNPRVILRALRESFVLWKRLNS